MALAYLPGKSTAKMLKASVKIPLVFVLSVIPSIDLLVSVTEPLGETFTQSIDAKLWVHALSE